MSRFTWDCGVTKGIRLSELKLGKSQANQYYVCHLTILRKLMKALILIISDLSLWPQVQGIYSKGSNSSLTNMTGILCSPYLQLRTAVHQGSFGVSADKS